MAVEEKDMPFPRTTWRLGRKHSTLAEGFRPAEYLRSKDTGQESIWPGKRGEEKSQSRSDGGREPKPAVISWLSAVKIRLGRERADGELVGSWVADESVEKRTEVADDGAAKRRRISQRTRRF